MSEKKPGRVVFLGDIPYDLNEYQVAELARTIGPITNVRLVTDRETNKSRGFAFVEFAELNSAMQAVQVLNGQPVGSRTLRVDFSNEATTNFRKDNPGRKPPKKNNSNNSFAPPQFQPPPQPQPQPQQQQQQQQPPQQHNPMTDVPHNLIVNDNISRTLSQFPPPQLLDVIRNMKLLTSQDPVKASEILHTNSHMTYALLQALLLMGLVDKDVVAQAVQGQPMPTTTNNNNYATPPPPAQPVQPLPQDPQEASMIQQVLALTQDQINSLPTQERNAIIAIREQYGGIRY
jgi:cleavage stimulation factor subunit 2